MKGPQEDGPLYLLLQRKTHVSPDRCIEAISSVYEQGTYFFEVLIELEDLKAGLLSIESTSSNGTL